jgi:Secretion system C-terminal sorting domain
MMKKLNCLLFSYLLCHGIMAQQIKPFIINCSGQSLSAASAQLSFNIGEIAITKISGTSNTITQGFLQAKSSLLSVENKEMQNDYSVYPNPTTDMVHFNLGKNKDSYTIKLIDAFGRIVYSGNLNNNSFSLASYTNGLYQSIVLNKNQKIILQTSISKIN